MRFRHGDILSLSTEAPAILVHGCNAQGVMGAGLAAQVKQQRPNAFAAYREAYMAGRLNTGSITLAVYGQLVLVNAVTQHSYGHNGRRYTSYDAVAECFDKVRAFADRHGIKDIHFPEIGCGLGGGKWAVVEAIIKNALPEDADNEFNLNLWTYK